MEHFKQRPDGSYRYDTGNSGEVMRVEVDYWKGRGVMLTIHPVEIHADHEAVKISTLFNSSFVVEKLERKKPTRVLAAAEAFDGIVAQIAARWSANQKATSDVIKALIADYNSLGRVNINTLAALEAVSA